MKDGVRVECYAGYRGDERPVRFYLGQRLIHIEKIADQWLDANHRYFKIVGDDGGVYILHQAQQTGRWEMTLFDSARKPDTKLSST